SSLFPYTTLFRSEIGCRSGLQKIDNVFFSPIADPVLARGDVRRGPIPFRALGAGEGVALDDAAERVARGMALSAMSGSEHEIGAAVHRVACLRIGCKRLAVDIETLEQSEPAA